MRMKFTWSLLALAGLLSPALGGGSGKGAAKPDYAELSRLVHGMVAGQFPRVYEHDTDWGTTIPIPDKKLLLPGLRTRVMVNGREELPHGLWRKFQARLDDPERDVRLRVRALEKQPDNTYRLTLDVDAALQGELELVHWQKGLRLVNVVAEGDVLIGMAVECAVKAGLAPGQGLGKVKLEPKVVAVKLGLKEFALGRVSLKRLGPVLEGEKARQAGQLVRGAVENMLRSLEPGMKDRFNEAIARSLADGKGIVPTAALLRALSPSLKKE